MVLIQLAIILFLVVVALMGTGFLDGRSFFPTGIVLFADCRN